MAALPVICRVWIAIDYAFRACRGGCEAPVSSVWVITPNDEFNRRAINAPYDQRISGEERTQPWAANGETAHDPKFLGMNARVGLPSVEWDCSNGGDAGCSWRPYGWEGTRN